MKNNHSEAVLGFLRMSRVCGVWLVGAICAANGLLDARLTVELVGVLLQSKRSITLSSLVPAAMQLWVPFDRAL
jgi:hypothetical protein